MTGILDAATPGQALAIALAMGKNSVDATDARRLLAAAAGLEPGKLAMLEVENFTEDLMVRYLGYVDRRAKGEPLSHIVGFREFYDHRFVVNADVLDPRPETEVLVRTALECEFKQVLDLGTGSGVILLSLLAARSGAQGVGTDVSEPALRVAQRNRQRLDLDSRATFHLSDWFENVSGLFDLIVSNPPYIAHHEMQGLSPELAYEPRAALTDESDGLSAYRTITADAGAHLVAGGHLMVEIGYTQGPAVHALFLEAGFDSVRIVPDLDGRDRVVAGIWPG